MNTQCTGKQLTLQGLDKCQIVVKSDAKVNSSDGVLLLMGELEKCFGIIRHLSKCFTDSREQYRVKHSLQSLRTQRIFAIIQGFVTILCFSTFAVRRTREMDFIQGFSKC